MEWPDRFQERLHIFAHGETLDVDALLANSTLRPDFVWRRKAPSTSGVEFVLGDGRAISLRDQEDIAITYLKAHRDELRSIATFRGVDAFILGMVYIAKLEEGVTGVALDWPPELMKPALDAGITPIHYIQYDRPAKPEQEPYAYFCLGGAFDPDDVTRKVGVLPSETARDGDAVGRSQRKRQNSLWKLRSRLQSSGDIDQHVTDVLDQIDKSGSAFAEVSRELGGVLVIVGFSRDYAPAISLGQETVGRLARYALRLDVEPNC
jgi:hypothetical protein